MIQVKIAEWRAMTIVAEPTATTGQIRKDSDGVNWESVVGGSKRTRTIKRVAKTVSVLPAPTVNGLDGLDNDDYCDQGATPDFEDNGSEHWDGLRWTIDGWVYAPSEA